MISTRTFSAAEAGKFQVRSLLIHFIGLILVITVRM